MTITAKQLADQWLAARETESTARRTIVNSTAEASANESWTTAQLEKGGTAHSIITDALALYHSKPVADLSPAEVSKFKTYAHPRVRGKIETCYNHAPALVSQYPTLNLREENVALKLMAKYKADDVSTVEQATAAAVKDYDESKAKRDKRHDTSTPEGQKEALKEKFAGKTFGKLYTPESIKLLLSAVEGLEPAAKAAPPEPDGEIADLLNNLTPEKQDKAKALLAALLT